MPSQNFAQKLDLLPRSIAPWMSDGVEDLSSCLCPTHNTDIVIARLTHRTRRQSSSQDGRRRHVQHVAGGLIEEVEEQVFRQAKEARIITTDGYAASRRSGRRV